MFDGVPTQAWLLMALAAIAFAPAQYVRRHVEHSPRNRDITQPPEELGWRTSDKLIRSLLLLAGLAGLAVFIFTPTAEQFAQSPVFLAVLMLGFSASAALSVVTGLRNGRIEPLSRGSLGPYERETQPKRFWASLSWNALLTILVAGLAFVTIGRTDEERCYDRRDAYTPQEEVSACNALIARRGHSAQERADILAARGYGYQRMGEYRKALADYDEAIGLEPASSYALYNRGLIFDRFGSRQRAAADYGASLELRPNNAAAYLNRGLVYLDSGRFDEAIAGFTRLHELEPANPWALANRGIAHAWKQDREQAERDFAAAVSLDPSVRIEHRGRAILDVQSGELPAAIDHLTRALRFDPADRWALRMRADLYWRLGEKEKARDDDDRLWRLRERAQRDAVGYVPHVPAPGSR